jgi:predicted alpha/beta hydrolase
VIDKRLDEIATDDGWKLVADVHEPRTPHAVAVLSHAMMVDRRTMDRPAGGGLASALAARGIVAINADLRGHGASGPTAREGGRWTYDDVIARDLPALVAHARARYPSLPVVSVGHSLGANASLLAAGLFPERAPDAIVALAPNLWAPRFEPSVRKRVAKGAALLLWAGVTAPRGYYDSRAFRMGSAPEPWSYVRQFLDFYFTNAPRSADRAYDYVEALHRITAPVFAVSSDGDTLFARPPAVSRFLGEISRAHVTHRVITAAEIDPPPDHMQIVTLASSRIVWREAADFIDAQRRGSARDFAPALGSR